MAKNSSLIGGVNVRDRNRDPKTRVDFFDGTDFDFLSNFYACGQIEYAGRGWMTTEAAFQAMKTLDEAHRDRIQWANSPGEAKRLGQRAAFEEHGVVMVPDWDRVKFTHMLELLRYKFSYYGMRQGLEDTGDAELVEGNVWNDTCWGVCRGVGQNWLGRQLMRVRAENRKKVKELWLVTAFRPGNVYVRTVQCKTLAAVRRATKKLAEELQTSRLPTLPGWVQVDVRYDPAQHGHFHVVNNAEGRIEIERVK